MNKQKTRWCLPFWQHQPRSRQAGWPSEPESLCLYPPPPANINKYQKTITRISTNIKRWYQEYLQISKGDTKNIRTSKAWEHGRCVEQHLHLADMSRPLEAESLLRRRPSHRLPFTSVISVQFKIFASCQNIKIQLKTKISKHWLAFTWPAGDSDADNTVVEQQKPSALCPAHLHPQHSKIENFTQNPECQSQYLSSTGCW